MARQHPRSRDGADRGLRPLGAVTDAALRLDTWLQARLGRPYNALLGVGLIIEIVRRIGEIPGQLASTHRLIGQIFVLALEAALLIHQVGALSHHVGGRRPATDLEHPPHGPAPRENGAA